ncbi:DUF3709 domain-containing protein, partial [Vibrio vulnificus]|nr:DUF3709 domain-containing protein [Vibrio vulnificus]
TAMCLPLYFQCHCLIELSCQCVVS